MSVNELLAVRPRVEPKPPDERAIYERSKTMPPIAAPPTVCPVCRITFHVPGTPRSAQYVPRRSA